MSKNAEIAAEATSAWALMDMKEKSILKPDVIQDNFKKGFDDEELSFTVLRRFKVPENPANPINSSVSEYKVRYSDIDTNLHMNNAAYIDLICDNLYYDGEELMPDLKKKILSLDLNYNMQAVFGDIIEINNTAAVIENTQEHIFSANIKPGGQNCFDAKVVISQ
jgi:acyl-ACP thioesterase